MHGQTPLITTIVGGLVLAFIFGTLAHRLRLPAILGYLIAGVVVGPFTPGFVADLNLAQELADIGVILLMFGVGLHFSVKDLSAVKAIAIPGAVFQMVCATFLGWGLSTVVGWPIETGILFGLALSCASTVVLLVELQARHLLNTHAGQIAVGWLIVEDMVMVLALVCIPAMAMLSDKGFDFHTISLTFGITIAKILVFVVGMIVFGKRAITWLFKYFIVVKSHELFSLSILAIALGVALGAAYLFGVSFALGAFFAGMILADSPWHARIVAVSLPLRDMFCVMFFVSVGMLFDPMVLIHEPLLVFATCLIIILGKPLVSFLWMLSFKYPVKIALTISVSLAQIGEFSFILAGLGIALNILSPLARDLILAGAIFSIIVNPFLFHSLSFLEKR